MWELDKDLYLLEYKKEDYSQDQHPMQSHHQEVDQNGLEELHQHQEVAYHQEVDHCSEEVYLQQEADSHQEEDSRMVEVDQEDHQEDHQEDPRVDRRQDHQVVEEALLLEAVDGIRTEI